MLQLFLCLQVSDAAQDIPFYVVLLQRLCHLQYLKVLQFILYLRDAHRYLMGKFPIIPVLSCIVASALIYIMVVKIRNTICSPPPQF
jgi:hypothetical protein